MSKKIVLVIDGVTIESGPLPEGGGTNQFIVESDSIPTIKIENFPETSINSFHDNVDIDIITPDNVSLSDDFAPINVSFDQCFVTGMSEQIDIGTVIKTATIGTEFESQYDYNRSFVQTTDNQFSLQTTYTYTGSPAAVDSGLLTTVELPYPIFDEVEINEIRNPHDYSSVEEMIAAGTQNMTVLVNNVAYDDNAYTISNPPSWLKYNGITATSILASGNTWFGINSSTEHIKFNRRDTKMYSLYREDGTVYDHFRFLKLRWRGYSTYNQTGSSHLQEWEVIFFDTGDVMIHAVTIPSSSYNGSFNIIASQTYTYNPLSTASPYVTFYSQNESHSVFEVKYEPIVLKRWLKRWNDKWLIEDEGVFYNIIDGELNPLEITEITAQNMIDFGNDEVPEGNLLLPLTEPKLHRWNDSDLYLEEPIQPSITAHLTAEPFPQTMGMAVDMSHGSITGISDVTAQHTGDLTVCYSLDDGTTYSEEESIADFLNEDFTAIYEGLPASKQLYLRFVFRGDAVLTNVKFTFTN